MVDRARCNLVGIWVAKDLGHSAAPLLRVRAVEAMEVLFHQATADFGGDGEACFGPERLGIAEHAIQIEDDPIGVQHVRREGLICRHRRKGSGARTLRA